MSERDDPARPTPAELYGLASALPPDAWERVASALEAAAPLRDNAGDHLGRHPGGEQPADEIPQDRIQNGDDPFRGDHPRACGFHPTAAGVGARRCGMSEDRDLDLALEEAFHDLHQDFSAKLAKAPRGTRVEITGRFELRHSSGEVITGRVDLVRQPAAPLRRNGWART